MPEVIIDYNKCTLKKECVRVCPMAVFEEEDGVMRAKYPDKCIMCRACEASCPEGAIIVR